MSICKHLEQPGDYYEIMRSLESCNKYESHQAPGVTYMSSIMQALEAICVSAEVFASNW